VNAVLGPGLRQHLQLEVGRLTILVAIVGLDGAHLLEHEGEPTRLAQRDQPGVVELADRDGLDGLVRSLRGDQGRIHRRVHGGDLDQLVGQEAPDQAPERLFGELAADPVALPGGRCLQAVHSDPARRAQEVLGLAVGHPGAQRHLDLPALRRWRRRRRRTPRLVDHGVGEQVSTNALEVALVELTLEEVEVGDLDRRHPGQAQAVGLLRQAGAARIGHAGATRHLYPVLHGNPGRDRERPAGISRAAHAAVEPQ